MATPATSITNDTHQPISFAKKLADAVMQEHTNEIVSGLILDFRTALTQFVRADTKGISPHNFRINLSFVPSPMAVAILLEKGFTFTPIIHTGSVPRGITQRMARQMEGEGWLGITK